MKNSWYRSPAIALPLLLSALVFILNPALALSPAASLPQLANAQSSILGAPSRSRPNVVYAAEPQEVPAGKYAVLEVRFQVAPGLHVNSHTPHSQLLIPTALTLSPASGIRPGKLQYPVGRLFSFSFDPGDKLSVYEGNFTVKVPVVATAGEHVLSGTLKYQACNNASCFPPKTLPVKILFKAK